MTMPTKTEKAQFKCSFCDTKLEADWKQVMEIRRSNCPTCRRKAMFLDFYIEGLFDNQMHIIPSVMADYLKTEYQFLNVIELDELYYFDGVKWNSRGREFVQKVCAQIVDFAISSHLVNEVINHIKYSTHVDIKVLRTAMYCEGKDIFYNFSNGVYDFAQKTLLPHDPKYYFTRVIPVNYDKEASYVHYLEYLLTMFYDDLPAFFNMIEAGAYILMPDLALDKAVLMIGAGGEGKGTWLQIHRKFIGEDNSTGITIQELTTDRFASADLHLKLANFATEGQKAAIGDSSTFKNSTTKDAWLRAQFKGKPSFTFHPTAKWYISTNNVPQSADTSSGFFDRILPVIFKHRYRDSAMKIPDLELLFSRPEQQSGMLNLYLEVLEELLKNGSFTFAPNVEEIKRIYLSRSDSAQAWMDECLVNESAIPEGSELEDNLIVGMTLLGQHKKYIKKEDVFKHYLEYCDNRTYEPQSEKHFWQMLYGKNFVTQERPKIDGKQYYCVGGMCLKVIREYESPKPLNMPEILQKYGNNRLVATIATIFLFLCSLEDINYNIVSIEKTLATLANHPTSPSISLGFRDVCSGCNLIQDCIEYAGKNTCLNCLDEQLRPALDDV